MAVRTKPIRTAVVGAGSMAPGQHLPGLRALGDRVEITAIVAMDADRAREIAEEWGAPHSFAMNGSQHAASAELKESASV